MPWTNELENAGHLKLICLYHGPIQRGRADFQKSAILGDCFNLNSQGTVSRTANQASCVLAITLMAWGGTRYIGILMPPGKQWFQAISVSIIVSIIFMSYYNDKRTDYDACRLFFGDRLFHAAWTLWKYFPEIHIPRCCSQCLVSPTFD